MSHAWRVSKIVVPIRTPQDRPVAQASACEAQCCPRQLLILGPRAAWQITTCGSRTVAWRVPSVLRTPHISRHRLKPVLLRGRRDAQFIFHLAACNKASTCHRESSQAIRDGGQIALRSPAAAMRAHRRVRARANHLAPPHAARGDDRTGRAVFRPPDQQANTFHK